jgi:hypothetical protein
MKNEARHVLAVVASATTVTATEVLLVAGARRMRSDAGSWPFSDGSTATTSQWVHALLSEALAASQEEWEAVHAKWVQRPFPDAALTERPRNVDGTR